MDFSEKYVKMCEKAKEIQEMWEPQIGDFFVVKRKYVEIQGDDYPEVIVGKGEVNVVHCAYRIEDYYPNSEGFKEIGVWLPRQDQLLEIWQKHDEVLNQIEELTPIDMHYTFSSMVDFLEKHFWWQKYASFEQAILAFVMYNLYKKIWDDQKEEWVKEVQND